MYAFLASAIPTAAALLVGAWLLIEQVSRKILRDRLVPLQAERSAIHARHHADRTSAEFDQAASEAEAEWRQLLRGAGIRPERLRRPTLAEVQVDLEVGNTLPWTEVTRQLLLIGGGLAGVVFLVLDLTSA